ncbi:hypothetical protein GP486_002982 [Trichoglossum hirsutum]|uniref:LAA1-like C-terminal TPR repeats domain-containing protein n=1 Tax=Trichoglossum hirsutum TaxID=265104 RepID=A0A9P8RRL6_9PEZI|nr:hypothetical protein GP486_002982 [Trichoglossum hirsutum]
MANERSDGSLPNPELDITKLQSLPPEQQELYLLTFTSDLVRHVSSLDADGASAHQIYLKKELFRIISLPSPQPTRVTRNNIGRCFAGIFGKGDRKLLFDSINELLGIVNGGKGEKDFRMKHAAVHCLGEIFGAAGDSAISLSSITCNSLLKLSKLTQGHAGLRGSVFKALGKLFEMIGGSADESAARDVWKQARNVASSDKAAVAQMSALKCLEALARETTYFDNSNDFDSLKTTIFKSFDSAVPFVRHAAASCLAAALVKSFSEDAPREAPVRVKKPKKPNRRQSMAPGDDEEIQRPESPIPRKPAMRLTFNLTDLLRQLSVQYARTSTTSRARAGIAVCYTRILKGFTGNTVERLYSKIVDHLLVDILSHPNLTVNRYKLLTARKFVRIILEDVVGRQILGETGQLNAAKLLVNDILKNYPQVIKERPEPSKHTLSGALSALASLVNSLGSAANSIADGTRDGLLQVLQHPSYTVQISTSHCLRAFVLACPQQLLPCVSICMNSVSRELNLLKTRPSPRRCVGYANGLSAVLSTAPMQPLYGSVDINSRVLSLATGLLKSSGNHELRISGTEIQVAWILIGGLMSLGPNFVKIHLSQLLLLWKNALPKPLAKDSMVQRSALELSFLAHVRECALGSVLSFLEFNSRLLTTDVSKRIAAMLQNTTLFLNSLPSKKTTEDVSQRLSPALQLHDLDLMVRRRVLQCYVKLVNLNPSGNETLLQSNLLTLAVTFFADPDNYSPSSLSTSIASSAGTFESVWDVGDNCGFGITGLVRGLDIKRLPGEYGGSVRSHWLTRRGPDSEIDQTLLSPICEAREHDSVSLYISAIGENQSLPEPPATEVVNSAINLFAISLPLQAPKVQESILEQIATFLAANSLQRDPGRKAAMTVNIALALLAALKVSVKETLSAPGDLRSPSVEKIIQEMLRGFVIHPDQYVRNVAYEALGRLCSSSGNAFTANEINYLVDMIVTNRDPNARAGCAVALGCIHSQVGGMAAGYHLKTIHGILMSLVADPHPTVHFWALEGLSKVADSAGLTYSGYVSSTLGMLAQLYVANTHDDEVASVATSNLELEFPTTAAVVRCIDSLVNVLGPDLQDMSKARDLIFTLVRQFQAEEDPLVLAESLRCLEHLSLYAAGHMEYALYVRRLQSDLGSSKPELRDVAIDGLYNLMKRDANDVIKTAEAGLEDQLWLALDAAPNHEGIQNLIRNWLAQTCLSDTALWIQRCQNVLTKTKLRQEDPPANMPKASAVDLQDEEAAGFAASAGSAKDESAASPDSGKELLKWQVRMFAMSCLSDILSIVGKEVLSDAETPAEAALVKNIADVVRMAFSASTSNVVELRVWGLRIIDQVLKIFGKTPDPDFAEASLLEQYQAQIGSALTPAFAADSSPELASEAVNVCAVFIATGIVTDVERMGRILKLLVSALENFSSDSETATIGDLKGLSSNAQVMVKMAVLSAWAELQVASTEQKYLVDVMKPQIATLTPLWLSSLREFARLRFEPDISMNTGPASLSGSLDAIYSALNRETLLKFYQDSWLSLVDAIASLIEQDSEFVFDALDGKSEVATTNGDSKGHDINYRDEPVAFFFVLFGIAFEALAGRPGSDSLATKEQTLEILVALKKILHPSVSGHAIYQEVIFSETMDLFDRLVLTEGLDVQLVVVGIARNMCISHPSSRGSQDGTAGGENLSEDVDQLFELTRIIVLVLAGHLPNLTEANAKARHPLSDEAVSLIRVSLDALVDAAEVFPSVIKTDLYTCIVHIFATILSTGLCQADIVPQSLPIFKRFIQGMTRGGQGDSTTVGIQIRGCLKRFLAILANAQKRETETSLPCVKNTLLAATILVTSSTNVLPASDPLITKLLDEIVDCLSDRMVSRYTSKQFITKSFTPSMLTSLLYKTSKVASNCSRSLLLTNPKSPCDQEIARHLIPHLTAFITADTEDPENARPLISHALASFTSVLAPSQIPLYFSFILPALLSRASSNRDSLVFRETSARLLELAAFDQGAFRSTVAQLSPPQRAFMEEVIRSGAGGGNSAGEVRQESSKPSIALRMDFGSSQ